ncbi:MAG: metallophosphoesterase family protein [Conexivisphaera sp.]
MGLDLKFGHLSDTHLGAAPYGLREREDDFYDALSEALGEMARERVSFVVHSGDVFDSPRPPGTALHRLARELRALRDRGIRFYFVMGEHDISRMREVPSPLLYDYLGLAVELRPEPLVDGDVELVGLHKRRRSEADRLREELARAGDLPRRGRLRVIALHQGLVEAHRYAGEISAQDLPRGFDYYAMGHLHDRFERRFDFLGGPLCYPGSTETAPGERIEEREKGFYVVDASGDEPSPQWVRLRSARPHMRREVRFEELRDLAARLAEEVSRLGGAKKPVLEVVVVGRNLRSRYSEIAAAIGRLRDSGLFLDVRWDRREEAEAGRIVRERPEDLRSKMMELAARALGSEELARFALEELLPHLREGDVDAAAEVLYDAFRRGRFG